MPKRTGSDLEEDIDDNKRHNNNPSPKSKLNMDLPQGRDDLLQDITELRKNMDDMKAKFCESMDAMTKKIGEVVITQNATTQATNFQSDCLEEVNEKCVDQQLKTTKIDRKLAQTITGNETSIATARMEIRQVAQDVKERNLILNGIQETNEEQPMKVAIGFLKNIDPTITEQDLETAYRMGKKGSKKGEHRVLLVKFKFGERKKVIMRKKAALKNKKKLGKIYCNDDLPDTTSNRLPRGESKW